MSILKRKEVVDSITKFTSDFMYDSMAEAKKVSDHPADTLIIMAKKLVMCQVVMFSFMAVVRKKEHAASFYKDMHNMANDGLDIILEHPERLLHFSKVAPVEEDGGVQEIVKLLQEMKTFRRKAGV